MYQKLLIASLIIGAGCMMGYAQDQKSYYATPEEAAKVAAVKAQDALLDNMVWHLSKKETKKRERKVIITKGDSLQQFLYEKGEKLDILFVDKNKNGKKTDEKSKDHNLKEVYDKLLKNATPVDLKYHIIEKKSKDDAENSTVSVEFETFTTANDSKARYKVVGTWEIEIKPITDKQEVLKNIKKDGTERYGRGKVTIGYHATKTTLKSIVANPADGYLSWEIASMEKSVKDAIVKWYANLPENLDKEYADQANKGIPADRINADDDIKIKREGRTFSVTGKKVSVSVYPEPYMTEPKEYYDENPKATLTVTPSFDIVVADDFKTIESMNVKYDEPEIKGPNTVTEKLKMRDKAVSTIKELGERLSAYVGANDKDQKNAILGMFVEVEKKDKSTVSPKVETSHRYKNGNETINCKKNAEVYLNRLKGSELTFVDYKMMDERMIENLKAENPDKFGADFDFDSNLYAVMFLVNQRYESKNYKDNTKKVVFLKHQDSGKYLIEKIEVVPNSTELE